MEGIRTRGGPHKIWKNEIEKDLNVMEMKHREAVIRNRREWRKIVLEA
jgi:hypothetical protein